MDIQELGQFESVYKPSKEVAFCWLRKQYVQLSTEEDHTEIANHANDSLRIWQAAKAQAVHEGFVLVPEDQAKDTDRLNFLLGGEKYIRTVIHRDIQNDEYEKIGEHFQLTEVFWIDGFDYWENTSSDSERGAIDKAMIEAQEPAND